MSNYKVNQLINTISVPDTIHDLAESSLNIETRLKSGMGLDQGLSDTYDKLVARYFETGDDLQKSLTRLGQNKIARQVFSMPEEEIKNSLVDSDT